MKKIIFLFAATSLTLFGMSYSQFKKNVLRHSKILQSNQLNLSASKQENTILMRPSNPTLELEVSQFNPEFGDTRPGYRATYGQAIRTGGFYDSLSQKAVAQKILQEAYVSEGEAGFLRELERLYTEYVYQNHLYTLLQQDLKISQRVANIAKDRYESGAESRAQYIQAKTEAMMAKTEILSVKREVTVIYYQMLGLAGFDKRVSLQKSFIYPVSAKITISTTNSPLSKILSAKKERFAAEAAVNDRSLKSFSLFGELEKEPDQSIARIGISVPIPFFNRNKEEKALATIKMRQAELDRQQLQHNETMQRRSLANSIRELSAQYHALRVLEKEQNELLGLFEEGYRISKGSLLDLMITKRRLIGTRKELLRTQKLANDQRIQLNYIQGKYND
jgi:outer membrane protein TolC